mgnify:CR=1 FL=1
MPSIMEKNRGERLILLYQNLPKGEKKRQNLKRASSHF